MKKLVKIGVLDVKAVVTVNAVADVAMAVVDVPVALAIVVKRVLLQMVVVHALKVDVVKIVMVTVG